MAFSLLPDRVYQTIYQLEPEQLAQEGVRLILADLDNTISPYSISEPTESVFAWTEALHQAGITLFILSNNRSETRIPHYCSLLHVPYLCHAGKPKKASFLKAMAQMGCKPEETVMVGDQLFTDVLGGKNAGLRVFLVSPIRIRDNLPRIMRHSVELPFIWVAKARQRCMARRNTPLES